MGTFSFRSEKRLGRGFTWRLVVLAIVSVLCLLSLSTTPDMYGKSLFMSSNTTSDDSGSHDALSWKNKTTLAHMVTNFRKMEYKQFDLVNYVGNRAIPEGLDMVESCKHIEHDAKLEYGNITIPIIPNYKVFSDSMNQPSSRFYNFLKKLAKGKPIESTFKKKWYMFGSSAEWLEEEQCYVVYSRLILSEANARDQASISLIAAQAFDKDWNELYGKRIRYLDVETPDDFEEQLKSIDTKYNITEECLGKREDYSSYLEPQSDPDGSESCILVSEESIRLADMEKQELIDMYFRTYPTVIDIPFKTTGDLRFMGPEDPKVIIRRNANREQEPLVIYNMNDKNFDRRLMFMVMPHRKVNPIVPLVDKEFSISETQKNWTPFIRDEDSVADGSRGFVHIVQHIMPITVLKCSLDDGKCTYEFRADKIDKLKKSQFKDLRGGTSFVRVPQGIPELDGRKLWLGVIKSHIIGCGGATHFYRPHLVLMEERDGKYSFISLSSPSHFHRDVLSWDMKTTSMKYINIMSPNSIVSWNVVSHDHENDSYEDYIEMSFSESDCKSYVLAVRGMLNYILQVLRDSSDAKYLDWDSNDLDIRVGTAPKCVISKLKEHCKEYGALHKEPSK